MELYTSMENRQSTDAQISNPWFTAQYNREREKLFYYACKLHKEFVIASECLRHNYINIMIAWKKFSDVNTPMNKKDKQLSMASLFQSIFLLTPVISTTFASAQTLLADVRDSGRLGVLIIDEAGQAQPQMALGAMMRCRKAIVVGDPKQIEPVVSSEVDMIKQLFTSNLLKNYKNKKNSIQKFADIVNPYGTWLGSDDDREWIGCPLIVHRRCIEPMYSISNKLSYDNTMKLQIPLPTKEQEENFIFDKSYWINVSGTENGSKDHFVKEQGEIVLKILSHKFQKEKVPKLYIITPFTSVKTGMIKMLKESELFKNENVKNWVENNNIGTVHTFQGKGTDEVIFLLGCDKNSISAANWVNKNLVNVAATRAKYRFYIIGDENVWMCKPVKLAREEINCTINGLDILNQC